MSSNPSIDRARRVYDLLEPRLRHLGLLAWLYGPDCEVLQAPASGTTGTIGQAPDGEFRRLVEQVYGGQSDEVIRLPNQHGAIPLCFGIPTLRRGVIFAVTRKIIGPEDARQLSCIARWMFADLCQCVKNDQVLGQFSGKLSQAYEETNLLFRLAGMLNCPSDPDDLMARVCRQLREVMPFGWMGIKFSSASSEVPQLQGRFFVAGKLPAESDRFSAAADHLLSSARRDPWKVLLSREETDLGQLAGSDVLAEPIAHDDQKLIGVILAGGKDGDDNDFVSGEMQFLDAAADFLGIFHQNITRFAQQEETFLGTLKALTASIDAKDTYTCGHSERVALLTRKLAHAMGIRGQELETYYVSALVHDVGKIGVPEAVLCKPGKLDEAEFACIRRHPEIGHGILKTIPAMAPMLPGVLHHHEHWNGRGYPHGLAGENIPLMARVITLADTFDAMNSNRSYRAMLPREHTLAEIRRCAGTQFDPALVGPFLALDFADFDRMLLQPTARAAA